MIFFLARDHLKVPLQLTLFTSTRVAAGWLIWLVGSGNVRTVSQSLLRRWFSHNFAKTKKIVCMAEIQRSWDVPRRLWYVELILCLSFSVAWCTLQVWGCWDFQHFAARGTWPPYRSPRESLEATSADARDVMTSQAHPRPQETRICSLNSKQIRWSIDEAVITTQEVYLTITEA